MPASDWADLCTSVIVWETVASRDAYGKPTYAAPVNFTGRRVYKKDRVPGGAPNQGADVIAASTIWILGTPDVKYDDRVYCQGDDAPYPPIVNVVQYPDENGPLFVKVMFGSAAQ